MGHFGELAELSYICTETNQTLMRRVLSISAVLILLLFESVAAQNKPATGNMVPAYDASDDIFIVCDYEESLIEVVPDSFICGYTFSPNGYKPYGIFLQKDSAGYRVILNYYRYDRDRIDDVMSTAIMEKSEWGANKLIEAAKRDIDRAIKYQKGPKVDIARDFNVVKVLMDGKAAEHWNLIFLNDPWYDVFYDFKYNELGPEPMPNANRWEVTPYFNPSEKSDESYHWIGSRRFIDMSMILRYDNNICGNVFADYWGSGGCIVTETDSKGRLVNATCTDERGFFYLQVMDPDVLMLKASLTRYDEERGKFVKYEPVVKKIAEKEIDEEYSSFWYTVSETRYLFNLNDAKVTRRPRFSKQKVIVVTGRKPTTDSAFTGVVMNAIGPLKDAVITEQDSKGNIISKTRTGANGEFRFDSVNPQNIIHISCEGYADIRHKIEGERFIITMKKK